MKKNHKKLVKRKQQKKRQPQIKQYWFQHRIISIDQFKYFFFLIFNGYYNFKHFNIIG